MSSVMKTLVSATVWILFVFGFAALVAGFGRVFAHVELAMVSAYFGYGILSLFLSAVTVKLRSTLG